MFKDDFIAIDTDLLQAITTEQAWHYLIVPKFKGNEAVEFFISDKSDKATVADELELLLGKKVVLQGIDDDIIRKTLGKYFRKSRRSANGQSAKTAAVSDDFLFNLIEEAHSLDCSDIHIEASEESGRVRMRIDGKLVERYSLPLQEYPALINKIKIRANLDIAEKRLPQDGRIFFENEGVKFDIRVSVLPTLYGEKAVLRLLSKDATSIDIEVLGFDSNQLAQYHSSIRKPHGIILISGPTGSGKTTTLYATLKILNNEASNILTIEDPIEYTLNGINQVQLKESIGLTFASALRTFLRQDPDIIMLGEIRDGETAQMAIRAALTGHLVLSTIHTNSAWGTVSRLIDMGVPPFLLAGTLNATLAQRLIRLLCPSCKKEASFDPSELPGSYAGRTGIHHHYIAAGCEECYYTGYKGRKAIYEVIPIDELLAEKIRNVTPDVKQLLEDRKILRLSDSAFNLFQTGETSLDEIYPILLQTI